MNDLLPTDGRIATAASVASESAGPGIVHVQGVSGCAAPLVANAIASGSRRVLFVASDLDAAERAASDLAFVAAGSHLGDAVPAPRPLLYSPAEAGPYSDAHPDRRAAMLRAATLFHLARDLPWQFLVTTAAGLARRVAPPDALKVGGTRLETGHQLDVSELQNHLSASGHLRVPLVEDPGTFAIRGGIIDVWSPAANLPIRAEMDGDVLCSLRRFDPETQRAKKELPSAWLPPARETTLDPDTQARARELLRSLCDAVNLPSTKARQLVDDVCDGKTFFGAEGYLPAFFDLVPLFSCVPNDTVIVVEDPPAVVRAFHGELESARTALAAREDSPHFPLDSLYVDAPALGDALAGLGVVCAHREVVTGVGSGSLDFLESAPADCPTLAIRDHADLAREIKGARSSGGKGQALDPLVDRIDSWTESGLRVVITARAQTQAERIGSLLAHRGIVSAPGSDGDGPQVNIVTGTLARGAVAPAEGFVLVTEEEIFGSRARRKPMRARSMRAVLEDLRALEPGDHVVHAEHGIGRYLGLEHKSINGVVVDLLVVEYSGGDKLFLPVYRLNQVQKYSGGEGSPKIDRLGGQSFTKAKNKVKRRVREMADQLLQLYAERNSVEKEPLEPRDDEYAAFEATFPYEETRDQAAAISEVMVNLESKRVMDRLVCGDVGFGKTEVALRAAFRVAAAGRQVALLCPTTVLAEQHFLTFSSRLADYPIEVRVLSRFQTKTEQRQTVSELKSGKVDVVIGTHRALSKDVHFKNLGLLIVDEEQRFGVTHKERIKQLSAAVDVLTLSATPIPRTLQLAIGGLREMSLITTPPVDRRSIRTITTRFDPTLLSEALERELSRGGQVFYVYNRIEDIHERASRVAEMAPRARIAVAHGQMSENTLEKTMLDFVDGKYDILVSTAIIESGLDIPRANTMIIDRADLFGLGQLYQLRGRVGRSSERAYCYLVVPPPSKLSDIARARVEALQRHTDLGSGFHIASLDLELRGGGDLLGAEQSGFVASVGFEMFCQMLEEATHELQGNTSAHEVDPELSLDVEALLPEDYVEEVGVRLSLYKRFAGAADENTVQDLAGEMEDRFGNPPVEARKFVDLMRLKTELRTLRVLGCEASARSVTLHLREDTPLDPVAVGRLVGKKSLGYRLTPDMRLSRRALESESIADGLELADKMLSEIQGCMKTQEN